MGNNSQANWSLHRARVRTPSRESSASPSSVLNRAPLADVERQTPPYGVRGDILLFTYRGHSMRPLFDERDILEVQAYGERSVAAGDVVLFESPGGGRWVVHRVTQVTPQGIHTRGDNNAAEDDWLLAPGQLYGRVVAAWRGDRRRPIAGGRAGRWLARLLQRWRVLRGTLVRVARLGRPLYRTLAEWGWLARRLPECCRPRLVAFQAPDGAQLRLLLGRRVVGHYDRERRRWLIRRLFRLLVDEASLPHPGE